MDAEIDGLSEAFKYLFAIVSSSSFRFARREYKLTKPEQNGSDTGMYDQTDMKEENVSSEDRDSDTA